MRLKAGGKLQRVQGSHFCNFSMRLVKKIFFYEHPEKMRPLHIKLQECTVIALYFYRARS